MKSYLYSSLKGFVTICGHTPNLDGKILIGNEFVNIDCNCGHQKDNSTLILYNLTDNVPIYIP